MFKLLILFSLLGFFSVDAANPNSLIIKFTKAEGEVLFENPYFEDISAAINEGDENGNTVDLTFGIKEAFPEDTMVMMTLERGDGKKKNFKMRLCDATMEAMLGRYLFENTIPNSFNCPAVPGSYTVKNYTPDQTFLPTATVSDGPFKIVIKFANSQGEAYAIGTFEGEIKHSLPIPSIGMM